MKKVQIWLSHLLSFKQINCQILQIYSNKNLFLNTYHNVLINKKKPIDAGKK